MVDFTREDIEKELGFAVPEAKGYHITVRVYERDEKAVKGGMIELPVASRAEDRFKSMVGQVVSMGSEAYAGTRFAQSGPWCKLGDWVLYARNAGPQWCYDGIPFCSFPDDKVFNGPIPDPSHITRDTL